MDAPRIREPALFAIVLLGTLAVGLALAGAAARDDVLRRGPTPSAGRSAIATAATASSPPVPGVYTIEPLCYPEDGRVRRSPPRRASRRRSSSQRASSSA